MEAVADTYCSVEGGLYSSFWSCSSAFRSAVRRNLEAAVARYPAPEDQEELLNDYPWGSRNHKEADNTKQDRPRRTPFRYPEAGGTVTSVAVLVEEARASSHFADSAGRDKEAETEDTLQALCFPERIQVALGMEEGSRRRRNRSEGTAEEKPKD